MKILLLFYCVLEQLAAIPEFRELGPLFKSSSEPVALTELETEYVIHCTKHTFTNHMVFQVGIVLNQCYTSNLLMNTVPLEKECNQGD